MTRTRVSKRRPRAFDPWFDDPAEPRDGAHALAWAAQAIRVGDIASADRWLKVAHRFHQIMALMLTLDPDAFAWVDFDLDAEQAAMLAADRRPDEPAAARP